MLFAADRGVEEQVARFRFPSQQTRHPTGPQESPGLLLCAFPERESARCVLGCRSALQRVEEMASRCCQGRIRSRSCIQINPAKRKATSRIQKEAQTSKVEVVTCPHSLYHL
jgi:hypothetical protein